MKQTSTMSSLGDEFQVVLLSNVGSNPTNKPNQYETALAKPLYLPGRRNVAIIDIAYQTFVVYMNCHVCIMYVSCIDTYLYIHEAMFQYMKNTWNFMYHVLRNLAIIYYCFYNYIRIKYKTIRSWRVINYYNFKGNFCNLS